MALTNSSDFPTQQLTDDVTPTSRPTLRQETETPDSATPRVWVQLGQDLDGVGTADLFGSAVSLSGDGTVLASGATLADSEAGGVNSGAVRVYKFAPRERVWEQRGQAINGTARLDRFGSAVAVSADGRVVAAASQYNDNDEGGDDAGHVRVFEYDEAIEDWVQLGSPITGEAAQDLTGTSLALSQNGRIVAIGSTNNRPDGETSTGHVRIFGFDQGGQEWIRLGEIDGDQQDDMFGAAVALSADGLVVAIGIPLYDQAGINSGAIQVYQYSSPTWNQRGPTIVGLGTGDVFGSSVALSESGAIVAGGARRGVNSNGDMTGHVRVFTYNAPSRDWITRGAAVGGAMAGEEFGQSLSLSANGNSFAAGAPRAMDGAGVARIYTWDGKAWGQVGDDIVGESANDDSAQSISFSQDSRTIAIGARFSDDGGTNSGHVRVYQNLSSG